MSNHQLIVLGTASQAPTRYRAHNAFALRWDDQLVLFDPGEGTQRQCILADVAIARLTAVCITHFHGDHSLGLPGVIQRRALDVRSASGREFPPLPVYFPADGAVHFDRLRSATIFHDTSGVVARPVTVEHPEVIGGLGSLTLTAAPLRHRVTTYGYRLEAPAGRRMLPRRLAERGITGPDVGRLVAQGTLDTPSGRVTVDEVSETRPPVAVAFIMDTSPCPGVVELARDADLAVFESTFLHTEVELADRYGHLTARRAAELALEAGVRRLVLGHFSARYPDAEVFGAEAAAIHPDVVVARDLLTVDLPPSR